MYFSSRKMCAYRSSASPSTEEQGSDLCTPLCNYIAPGSPSLDGKTLLPSISPSFCHVLPPPNHSAWFLPLFSISIVFERGKGISKQYVPIDLLTICRPIASLLLFKPVTNKSLQTGLFHYVPKKPNQGKVISICQQWDRLNRIQLTELLNCMNLLSQSR